MVAIISALLVELPSTEKPSGVTYDGKPLEYWLSQTICTVASPNGNSVTWKSIRPSGQTPEAVRKKNEEVKHAFQAIGTN